MWGAALLEQAIHFAAGVANALQGSYPEECFRVVLNANPYLEEPPSGRDFSFTIYSSFVPADGRGWVVRFHKLRTGQPSWPDPIADYPEPALAVTVSTQGHD